MIFYQNIIFSGLILILLILILTLVLGGFLIFSNFEYRTIEEKITIEQSRVVRTETVKGMERKVRDLNRELAQLKQIQNRQSNVYQILDNISQKLLKGVEIYNLEIDRESGKIMISGFSPTRDNLLTIKQILEATPEYKNVDFPLSNLTDPKDIKFYFSFTLHLEPFTSNR